MDQEVTKNHVTINRPQTLIFTGNNSEEILAKITSELKLLENSANGTMKNMIVYVIASSLNLHKHQ